MTELALLESSLESSLGGGESGKREEKGLTAEEEENLDSIMQSLDIDSEGEDDGAMGEVDLEALGAALSSEGEEGGDLGTRDFEAEFGLCGVCWKQGIKQLRSTQNDRVFSPVMGLHTQHSVYLAPAPHAYGVQSHLQRAHAARLQLLRVVRLRHQVRHALLRRHLARRRQRRHRLRHQQHRVALQTRHCARQRHRLELRLSASPSTHHRHVQRHDRVRRQLQLRRHARAEVVHLLLRQVPALRSHTPRYSTLYSFPALYA